jgi:hypothetical protein
MNHLKCPWPLSPHSPPRLRRLNAPSPLLGVSFASATSRATRWDGMTSKSLKSRRRREGSKGLPVRYSGFRLVGPSIKSAPNWSTKRTPPERARGAVRTERTRGRCSARACVRGVMARPGCGVPGTAPSGSNFRGSITRPLTSLSTLRRMGCPTTTQYSFSA